MAHGGLGKRRVVEGKRLGRRSKGPGVDKKLKPKAVSIKNLIRSIERMLRKELTPEVREAQEKKLDGLKKQQEIHARLAVERKIFLRERKIFLRDRKIKFFERRKIERRIRRLEKQQRTISGQAQDMEIAEQLSKLKEDLEYVRFFPKTEKYISLFTGGDDSEIIDRRNRLRKQIKSNLVAAAASGRDLEETGSEDDGLLDLSDDDFFLSGSSSEEADADDEWTESTRCLQYYLTFPSFSRSEGHKDPYLEVCQTQILKKKSGERAPGIAASSISSDERNKAGLMLPPRPSNNSFSNSVRAKSRFGSSSSRNSLIRGDEMPTSSNTSKSRSGSSYKGGGSSNSKAGNIFFYPAMIHKLLVSENHSFMVVKMVLMA
ncbi:CBL-interacting protein kinase 4 [Hibiscus syriacus]|uniref:rRNA-processing protein EFG1 n=1 Tax=Hibiscus syriacus TaxID=106335 RepID=A0A6A3CWR2_HIBSY|nr:CBL-interacting protein kinase 4 [Hibiscus syriacus]